MQRRNQSDQVPLASDPASLLHSPNRRPNRISSGLPMAVRNEACCANRPDAMVHRPALHTDPARGAHTNQIHHTAGIGFMNCDISHKEWYKSSARSGPSCRPRHTQTTLAHTGFGGKINWVSTMAGCCCHRDSLGFDRVSSDRSCRVGYRLPIRRAGLVDIPPSFSGNRVSAVFVLRSSCHLGRYQGTCPVRRSTSQGARLGHLQGWHYSSTSRRESTGRGIWVLDQQRLLRWLIPSRNCVGLARQLCQCSFQP